MVLPPSGIRACSSEVAGAYFWYLELVLPPFQVCSSEIVGAWICSALVGAASLLGPGLQFWRRLFFFAALIGTASVLGPGLQFWKCRSVPIFFWQLELVLPSFWIFNLGPNWPMKRWGPKLAIMKKLAEFVLKLRLPKITCLQKNKRLGPAACQGPSMSPKKLSCFF